MSLPSQKPTVLRQTAPGEPAQPAGLTPAEIDLRALADKVYDLLKRDLRLERERLGAVVFGRGER
jgi:hypothetical protein